jgi:ATP-dependent helicase STH1/SNF2
LIQQREVFNQRRIQYRIKELEALPSTISTGSDLKMKALIELKSLKLLDFQKKLKKNILTALSQQTTLATALDRSAFRHVKKPSLREARQTEKQERAQRSERDKRERQKHVDYLDSILIHSREFMSFHRGQISKIAKLTQSVIRLHSNAAKEEERRMQRVSADRLNALKSNDEEAYLKLLDKSKDTRITHLLSQTNSFLKTLTNAVQTQKASVQEVANLPKKTAEDGDDDDLKDYYDTAHSIKEEVFEQSSLLVGGTLKDYQIKGLQWMVSLYNNRLNGILADEMGLGKTIQTLSLITYLIEKKSQPGPYLIIVPLSTITNWVNEFEKWCPNVVKIVYKGNPNARRELQNLVKIGQFNCLLTTYEYIINPKDRPVLSRIKWVHMIIDEGHRMKNANSKLSVTLMQFYSARYRIILTGTPLQVSIF